MSRYSRPTAATKTEENLPPKKEDAKTIDDHNNNNNGEAHHFEAPYRQFGRGCRPPPRPTPPAKSRGTQMVCRMTRGIPFQFRLGGIGGGGGREVGRGERE